MDIDTRDNILKWEQKTTEITETFLYDYFDDVKPSYFWVCEEVGGILNYGDYWFNFSDILTCYKLGITEERLINWYDFCLDNHSVNISLSKFILSPEDKKKAEEKHLDELKDRIKTAQEEFDKALNNLKM